MEVILVGIGGALGAVLRYLVGQLLPTRAFPWGPLVVNALGSFVLGVVIFGVTGGELLLVAGVGFCGAFTTFSSFSFQTVALWERTEHRRAVMNAIGNLVLSILAFGGAWLLVS